MFVKSSVVYRCCSDLPSYGVLGCITGAPVVFALCSFAGSECLECVVEVFGCVHGFVDCGEGFVWRVVFAACADYDRV